MCSFMSVLSQQISVYASSFLFSVDSESKHYDLRPNMSMLPNADDAHFLPNLQTDILASWLMIFRAFLSNELNRIVAQDTSCPLHCY